MDGLLKVVDPNQLTPDLEGTLQYDHATWIDLRCVSIDKTSYDYCDINYRVIIIIISCLTKQTIFQSLEDFLWQSSDMLDRLDDMREDLAHNDFADDVGGAKKGMEQHTELRRKILKVPVENIDNVGQRILQRYVLTSNILSINRTMFILSPVKNIYTFIY